MINFYLGEKNSSDVETPRGYVTRLNIYIERLSVKSRVGTFVDQMAWLKGGASSFDSYCDLGMGLERGKFALLSSSKGENVHAFLSTFPGLVKEK